MATHNGSDDDHPEQDGGAHWVTSDATEEAQ